MAVPVERGPRRIPPSEQLLQLTPPLVEPGPSFVVFQSPDPASTGAPDKAPRMGLREQLARLMPPSIVPEQDMDLVEPKYAPDEFSEQVVFITGLSHRNGFAYAFAKRIIGMGAKTFAFNYREETPEVKEIVRELTWLGEITGTKVVAVQADISKRGEAQGLVKKVVKKTGQINVYVDNAGVIALGAVGKKSPKDTWHDLMVNVVGPRLILGEVVRQMDTQPRGFKKVVNMISVGANGVADQYDYSAAKAYKTIGSRSLAQDSAIATRGREGNIETVNIAPGLSSTAMTSIMGERAKATVLKMVGQEKEIMPDEVAGYMVFAASSHCSGPDFNGSVIPARKPMRKEVV